MFYHCIKPKFLLKNMFSLEEIITEPTGVSVDFTETEHQKYELFETDKLNFLTKNPKQCTNVDLSEI